MRSWHQDQPVRTAHVTSCAGTDARSRRGCTQQDHDLFGKLLTSVEEISGKRNVQSTVALRSSIRWSARCALVDPVEAHC